VVAEEAGHGQQEDLVDSGGEVQAADCTDWVAFVDDDDTLHHMYVEWLAAEVQRMNKVAAAGDATGPGGGMDVVLFRMLMPYGQVIPCIANRGEIKAADVGISFAFRSALLQHGEPPAVTDQGAVTRVRASYGY